MATIIRMPAAIRHLQDVYDLIAHDSPGNADRVVDRIYLAKKLERAEEDRRTGRVTSHEEFEKEMDEWLA